MADLATLGIRVTTQGVREAASDLDKLDKSGERTAKTASSLGKAWGVALGGAIAGGAALAVAGLKRYITNSIEAERIQAQLVATIKSTGGAAGLAVNQLNDMADALMRATTFDDESINQVQGLLLTFTKIGSDVFPRATEAVLDMSTALGVDLKSAAMQVGKALNDPVAGLTALSRAGVQFSETQKETINDLVETGDVAQAQTIILRELETQMGGSARAARDTLGGALQALQNSFDNLLEGDAGSGGVRGTRDAIESLTRTLNDPAIKRGIDDLASGLLTVANGAIQVVAKLGEAGSAVFEFFGQAENRSSTMLRNQRDELETQMFGLQRRIKAMGPLNSVANPLGVLTAVDQDALAKVKREIAEIDAILARRARPVSRGALFSDQGAIPASMLRGGTPAASGGAADPDAPARIRDRTKATQELSAAELAHRSIMEDLAVYEDLWAQNARDAIAAEYERQKQVENGIASTQALISDMEFELALLGMTNKQRMEAIALRQADVNATDDQIAKIRELANAQYEGERSAALWDNAQRSLSDSIFDAVSGTKSLKDAVLDFLDSLSRNILQQFADDWAETITSSIRGTMSSGSTGSSGGNNWIADLVSLFSSSDQYTGFSKGGYTGPGPKNKPAGIVHAGEYVLNAEAVRNLPMGYLDALNAGGRPGGMSVSMPQTFIVQGTPDRRTREQMARDTGREAQRGLARTGR